MSREDVPDFRPQGKINIACRDCIYLGPWESLYDKDYCEKWEFDLKAIEFETWLCNSFKLWDRSHKVPGCNEFGDSEINQYVDMHINRIAKRIQK